MILEINSLIPLVTILGAAAAPTIAAVWARRDARMAAERAAEVRETLIGAAETANTKLDTIHSLVNSQLSQAVDRLTAATREIQELKRIVKELQKAAPAKRGLPFCTS
jgi:major membrane immunogen (membrane-anchored lipoprotein)